MKRGKRDGVVGQVMLRGYYGVPIRGWCCPRVTEAHVGLSVLQPPSSSKSSIRRQQLVYVYGGRWNPC